MYSEEKENQFHNELKVFIDETYEFYVKHRDREPELFGFFINLYEDKFKDATGGKMEFVLQGLEANFIKYPDIYRKFIDNYDEEFSIMASHLDTMAIKFLVALFRKADNMKAGVYNES